MRVMWLAALAGIMLAAAGAGRDRSEGRVERVRNPLVGKWKLMAWEGPDGKETFEDPTDPYLNIQRDSATGHLAIRLRGNPKGTWSKLEIDADRKPNLYWIHLEIVLQPLPRGNEAQAGVLGILWAQPEVEERPDGTGVLRKYIPVVLKVDGDTLKMADGQELAGKWDAPDLVNAKDRHYATYYTRVKGSP